MKGHICHIEIPADNLGTLQKFYSRVFEWDFEKIPGDMEYYGIIHEDEKPMAGADTSQ
jgi:predicted enzyme related to lactoylglutathione lyase